MAALLLILWLTSVRLTSASTDLNCGNSSSSTVCPGASVELYCQTSSPVLIWNVLGAELDFTVKDTIGASESIDGIVAELTGRSGGTQSRLWFTMPSIESHNVSCYDGLGSEVSCQINRIGYPGHPINFTCQSNGSNIILMWSLASNDDLVKGFDVQAIPESTLANDCSVLNYSNVSSNTLTVSKSLNDSICGYTTYTVTAFNCIGQGQPAICAIEQDIAPTVTLSQVITHAVQSKTATILKSYKTLTVQMSSASTNYLHNETSTVQMSLTQSNATTAILFQTHAASPTIQQGPTASDTYLILIIGTVGVTVSIVICVVSFLIAALLFKKLHKPVHFDANIQQTHHEEEWFNMTDNVVYECPIKLQDNSAYASIRA